MGKFHNNNNTPRTRSQSVKVQRAAKNKTKAKAQLTDLQAYVAARRAAIIVSKSRPLSWREWAAKATKAAWTGVTARTQATVLAFAAPKYGAPTTGQRDGAKSVRYKPVQRSAFYALALSHEFKADTLGAKAALRARHNEIDERLQRLDARISEELKKPNPNNLTSGFVKDRRVSKALFTSFVERGILCEWVRSHKVNSRNMYVPTTLSGQHFRIDIASCMLPAPANN